LNKVALAIIASSALLISGCSTTNSIPYKASTANVISIQESLETTGVKVNIGKVTPAPGVEESPMCRLMGPVKVAPGKSPSRYIQDAFQEELFMAGVYSSKSPISINGSIKELSFSSVSPANWKITLEVSSNVAPGYTVSTNYAFDTSWDAYSACKNVADAFGPAVQELLKQVVTHPQFASLTKQKP